MRRRFFTLSMAFLAACVVLTVQNAEAVKLQWDANTEPDLKAYSVYRSHIGSPCIANLAELTAVIMAGEPTELDLALTQFNGPGLERNWCVTASDTSGNESGVSNTVTSDFSAPPPPPPPADVTPPAAPQNLRLVDSSTPPPPPPPPPPGDATFDFSAELPRVTVDLSLPWAIGSPPGITINVEADYAGDFQAAINAASPGDAIVLDSTKTYTPLGGPYVLPDKGAGTTFIVIRTDAYASLVAPGTRVGPSDSVNMPTISVAGSPRISLIATVRAHHYRIIGLNFQASGASVVNLIQLSRPLPMTEAEQATEIIFDRSLFQGDAVIGTRRGRRRWRWRG